MANSLIHETSPYLLQHAHNPVNWFAWNDKALEKAKSENKMLLISVGYAACHWCHVMEHESFENEEVAAIMNEHFICIKVDREERPDVDQVYMDAAYLINGNGGWPLNALAMPNGKPFFAGTYFPKENWMRLLQYFAEIFKTTPSKLEEQANQIANGIKAIEMVPSNTEEILFHLQDVAEMVNQLMRRIDWENGGTQGSMKFPMPSIWEFLLQDHYFSGDINSLKAVEITLLRMAQGGIFDQIGGGFSRYATDTKWHAPHFEKMLYDNAQLVSLYSHAFQLTKNPLYKKIVDETLEFISRELTNNEGGFYASLDADSEKEEGKFYVWKAKEIKVILGEDSQWYCNYYGITEEGNWENGKNIPDINYGENKENIVPERVVAANKKLLQEREKRIRPATDDKILTSWNALMAKGYLDAYHAFGEKKFLSAAKKNIDFLLKNLANENNSLYRNYKNEKASIPAFLDDYAFLISALIQLYQMTFEEYYLLKAKSINDYVDLHFFDPSSGMYFYTDDQYSNLIARKMEVADNVIPSSNSEMAKNLLILYHYFYEDEMKIRAEQMIKNVWKDLQKNTGYYSNWAIALNKIIYPHFETAIAGNQSASMLAQFGKEYLPNTIFMGGEKSTLTLLSEKSVQDDTLIYVCQDKVCHKPVQKVNDAIQQIVSSNNK